MNFTEAMLGKPFTWRTNLYGDVAVHVSKFSPNGAVAVVSIDGGPDATPCHRFPELSDGIGFATQGQLLKRARQTSERKPTVNNVIRDVPGVGKVATVTTKRAPRVRKPKLQATFSDKEVTF